MKNDIVLGIDFGTSYSSAAILRDDQVHWVLDRGDPMVPSVVHVPSVGPPVVGIAAQVRLATSSADTIRSIKRLLGRKFDDREVRLVDAGVGYRIESGPRGRAMLNISGQQVTCEQVAAYVLTYLRDLAELRFGSRITKTVIAVPAAATPGFVSALRRAARIAHLQLLDVIPEPIAGALSLGMHEAPQDRRIVVCDFGGGTFDATLVEQHGLHFVPLACCGDSELGGDDFDGILAAAVATAVHKRSGFDLRRDVVRWHDLLMRCESAKRIMSRETEARLSMTDAFVEEGKHQDIDLLLDRAWAEAHWKPLIDRTKLVLARLMTNSGFAIQHVDDVILIGGTSLVPLVREGIAEFFEREEVLVNDQANVAVAYGATLQTAGHLAVSTQVPCLRTTQKTPIAS